MGVNSSHKGIFNAEDVAEMRDRLRQGDAPTETASERENRAMTILQEKESGQFDEAQPPI